MQRFKYGITITLIIKNGEVVTIANDNKGFLIAIVIVLALAVFSGGIRDNYQTTGYAGLTGDPGYGGHSAFTQEMSNCKAQMDEFRAAAGPGQAGRYYDDYLACKDAVRERFGR